MIFTTKYRTYFKLLHAKVSQAMGNTSSATPYYVDDPIIKNYELIRSVWVDGISIKELCITNTISRTQYYEQENAFIKFGFLGLFPEIKPMDTLPQLERLIILIHTARPSISQQAMLRIAQALPLTQVAANNDSVSQILTSYGRSSSDQAHDQLFWERIQRTVSELSRLKQKRMRPRNKRQRRTSFFLDSDPYHKRLELLREISNRKTGVIKDLCMQYGIAPTNYYRTINDYRLYGPWAIIPAHHPGKEAMNSETELNIIVKKLQYPAISAQEMVKVMKLRCSRFAVNRVFSRWKLTDRNRIPVALDHYCSDECHEKPFIDQPSAYTILPEQTLLQTRRINRNFTLICRKMRTHSYHLCDPGPFILAPFLNDLGIVQAMECYGPPRLRGKELTNLALLNVFRIVAGYRRINHLSNNRDHSVALASGVGLFGTRSRYYQDTLEFKFDQLHSMRCDLVRRSKELGIIKGNKIAFDFHFKKYFGCNSKEKGIGKGPDKAGNMVPGFRPHVAWDLATNTILNMSYYQGAARAPGIMEQYCEHHIFPLFDPEAIHEIYMDSEYTKEASLQYFKQFRCPNGDVYICLKKNKQIQQIIAPVLSTAQGWVNYDKDDEINSINTILPKTRLPIKIVILRDKETRKNIRCFGSTNTELTQEDILKKYSYRWLIENGLKDLVYSYFIDEMYGNDPEKIEYEFYCVMVARLAYELFLSELGGENYRSQDGNKTTLQKMRNLLFEKRNFTLEENASGNFILTFLDSAGDQLEENVATLLNNRMEAGTNKVLWWNNRGLILKFDNQYKGIGG